MREQIIIKTRDRVVRYLMSDFIKAVQARPILWERYHADYFNRDKRELAWQEVATSLYSKFDTMSAIDKHKTVVVLTKRWKNTRDSFFRAHRRKYRLNRNNEEHHKTYVYEKELSFLLHSQDDGNDEYENEVGTDDNNEADTKSPTASKEKHKEEAPIKIEAVDDDNDNDIVNNDKVNNDNDNDNDGDAINTPSKKKRRVEETPLLRVKKSLSLISPCDISDTNEIVDIPKTTPLTNNREHSEVPVPQTATVSSSLKEKTKERTKSNPHKPSKLVEKPNTTEFDADQSFFDSIKPVIQNMSMDQKLDFQIEVLKLLKTFRGKQ